MKTNALEHVNSDPPANPVLVRVDLNKRGAWELQPPERDEPVTCKSREDASRAARRYAARRRSCTRIARDAYWRGVRRERIFGRDDVAPRHGWFG